MLHSLRKKLGYLIYPEFEQEKITNTQVVLEHPDPINFMRKLLGLVTIDIEAESNYMKNMEIDEIKAMHAWGYQLSHSAQWDILRKWALNAQAAQTISNIPNDEKRALMGCGRLDGIMFIQEEVERLRAGHENDMAKSELYDKHNLIQD